MHPMDIHPQLRNQKLPRSGNAPSQSPAGVQTLPPIGLRAAPKRNSVHRGKPFVPETSHLVSAAACPPIHPAGILLELRIHETPCSRHALGHRLVISRTRTSTTQ